MNETTQFHRLLDLWTTLLQRCLEMLDNRDSNCTCFHNIRARGPESAEECRSFSKCVTQTPETDAPDQLAEEFCHKRCSSFLECMSSDPWDSRLSLDFTYHYDKLSCLSSFYYVHTISAYIVLLSGVACFVTRAVDRLKWSHYWFGRVYLLGMLYATGSSLLIHNTGLPIGVLSSFVWVILGLTFGWIAINIHQKLITQKATERVESKINQGEPCKQLEQMIATEKNNITAEKTFSQRMLSYKTLHGVLMVISWFGHFGNFVGRIGVMKEFTCHTYPVYKQVNSPEFQGADKPLTQVPIHDPRYSRLPWANREVLWFIALLFVPTVIAIGVAALWSWRVSPKRSKL
ncbi:hypothetical protein EDD86DRAFT_1539 [Gorgonomyces haynaldii]|nr:hypothetical protein EDD86DRAFT_1539 [Gorgonomyces haynaldii]